jgi:hypothetical protein
MHNAASAYRWGIIACRFTNMESSQYRFSRGRLTYISPEFRQNFTLPVKLTDRGTVLGICGFAPFKFQVSSKIAVDLISAL